MKSLQAPSNSPGRAVTGLALTEPDPELHVERPIRWVGYEYSGLARLTDPSAARNVRHQDIRGAILQYRARHETAVKALTDADQEANPTVDLLDYALMCCPPASHGKWLLAHGESG